MVVGRVLAGLSLVSLAVPLLAQQTNGSNGSIVVEGQKPEKKVCKDIDAPTGSRVGSDRICLTEAEWRRGEEQAQRAMDHENMRFNANRAAIENEKNRLNSGAPR